MWLASLTAGLFRFERGRTAFAISTTRTLPGLGNDFVTGAIESNDSTLVVTTLRGGAFLVQHDSAVRITSDRTGGVGSGHVPARVVEARDEVWDATLDRNGRVWLATAGGLCAVAQRALRCVDTLVTVALARDREGWLWLARGEETVAFDPVTERAISSQGAVLNLRTLFADSVTGTVWAGGNGVARGVPDTAHRIRWETVPNIPTSAPTSHVMRDSRGALWFATSNGVWTWPRPDSAQPTRAAAPALASAKAFSIAADDAGSLWIGTSRGLLQVIGTSGVVRQYAGESGVTVGEFTRHAVRRLRSGELIFGGAEGLVRFSPRALTADTRVAAVVFTSIERVTDSGTVSQVIGDSSTVGLDPRDHALMISFATLRYDASTQRRYRYRFGRTHDGPWIETREHVVSLAAPQPGTYHFEVEAAVNEAPFAGGGSSLLIDVAPAFWQTWWFRLAVLSAIGAAAAVAHRAALSRATAEQALRQRISHDLHDEIGAGLSSLALRTDLAERHAGDSDATRDELQRIGSAARTMAADLRDIVWAIEPGADTLDDLVERMRDVVSTLLPGCIVRFDVPEGTTLGTRVDMTARRDLFLLYKEVLHNIAKHARATEVRVSLDMRGSAIVLTVVDNGVGFLPSDARGRGIGHRSMTQRAARLGARLTVDSAPGRGTRTEAVVPQTRTRRSRPTIQS